MKTKTDRKDKLFLVAITCFQGEKGFCHRTILLRAKDAAEARCEAHKRATGFIGDIKEVNYD